MFIPLQNSLLFLVSKEHSLKLIHNNNTTCKSQHAKKVVFNSPGLVEFNIGLVIFVLNLPDGQANLLRNSNYKRTVINPAHHQDS